MALQALWSPEQQFQNTNGSILTNGKIYIQYRGRTALAEVFGDASGEHRRANPVILDANGRALCFADDSFSYTAVVCDFYGKELFSFDPIPCGAGSGSSQVTGAPSAHWLGRFGDTRVVSAGQYSDSLPLPANPDYDGSFIESIQGNSNITLATGLYIIDAIVRFRQNPDDLQNLFGQVQVFTGWRDDETTWELRNETGPDSSQEDMHQFRVHLVRHVTGNGDKNFCIQVKTPVNWSWCQIQSLSILSMSSSSGGYGQYIPGDYIQIENDGTINVVGLQPSGNYANAESVAQAFYGVAQDMNALSGQINEVSGQIPSLDGYATETWVNDQGFLKEVPSEFVTDSELNSAISGKADKSEIPSLEGYATEEWVRQQNYLTEVPDNYVERDELSAYATDQEVQAAVSGKADKSEIPSLDGYATETYVQEQVSGLASESYVQSQVSGKQDELEFTYDEDDKITSIDGHEIAGTGGGGGSTYSAGQYVSIQNDIISVTGLQPSGEYLTQDDLNGYATDDDVQAAVSGKADKSEIPSLQGYATEEWVGQQGYLTSVPSEYITETELESELSGKADVSAIPSVAGLASETYVDQKVEEATSGKADVSAIPSLQGYATESWVNEQGFLKEVPQGYATVEDVESATSGKMDASEASAFYPMASNPSGYLTEHQSLAGYATEQYVQDQISGFVDSGYVSDFVDAAVSGKQDALEFGYTSDGSVSAINNSGIYDAPLNDFVNQNSGAWGGEALPVSGGPGIKFRMDNGTLIAEADETMLWSGDALSATLSESLTNFESVRVYAHWEYNGGIEARTMTEIPGTASSFNLFTITPAGTTSQATNASVYSLASIYNVAGLNLTPINKSRIQYAAAEGSISCNTYSNTDVLKLTKVLGINRIAGGN